MLPGLTQREFQELLLSVGKTTRARRPLSPVEVGELCAKSIEEGASPKELTEALRMTDRNMISKFLRLRDSHSLGPAPGLLGVFQRERHRVLRRRSLGPPARRQTDNLLRSHREISPYAKRDDVGDPIARTLPTATRSVRGASSPPTPYRSHSTACAGSRHVSRFRAKASSTFPAPERRTPGADRPSSVPKRQGLHCEARHRSVRDHRWKERRGDRRDGFDGRTKCQQVFGGRTSVIPQRRKNRGARANGLPYRCPRIGSGPARSQSDMRWIPR